MTSPRSRWSSSWPAESSRQDPTAAIRFPEMRTAPSLMGGRETGTTSRARRNMRSDPSLLPRALGVGGHLMFAGLMLIVAFPNLLFDFLGDDVNCSIKIAFDIFREQVGAAEIQADGTGELLFGGARVVVFERDAGI